MSFIVKNVETNSAKKLACDRASLVQRIESVFNITIERYILQERDEETKVYFDVDNVEDIEGKVLQIVPRNESPKAFKQSDQQPTPMDCNGPQPTDSNSQLPTDSNSQLPTDSNSQQLTDSNSQLPTDSNSQPPITILPNEEVDDEELTESARLVIYSSIVCTPSSC